MVEFDLFILIFSFFLKYKSIQKQERAIKHGGSFFLSTKASKKWKRIFIWGNIIHPKDFSQIELMRNLGNLHSLHFPIYWRFGHWENDESSCIVTLLKSILRGRVLELGVGGGAATTTSDGCNFPPTPLLM